MMPRISYIHARQILDSRGNPTVECDVALDDGAVGRAAVPSGASTGSHEAHELRDGGDMYKGRGVMRAVEHVNNEITTSLTDREFNTPEEVDMLLIEQDGTKDKSRLGANAILAVSLAVAKAFAQAQHMPLYHYVSTLSRVDRTPTLPTPMANIINGGKHAAHSTDIQEFMIVPVGVEVFSEKVRAIAEIYHALGMVLEKAGYATTVGDEGGYAPRVRAGNREALALLTRATESAGYTPGTDIAFAIDAAASEFYDSDKKQYVLASEEGRSLQEGELVGYYAALATEFPLISIEDGLDENDWEGWVRMNKQLGEDMQLVGDDLLVTNVTFLHKAIEKRAANAILIKPNQIGTLTETIDAVDTAHENGWNTIISHRSGETEDTTIAHLAVGLETGQIKAGSVCRGERTAKYNELLRIEEELPRA